MVLQHIIEFLVDYFTNINLKKAVGGAIILVGLTIIGRMGLSEDINILYAIVGIAVGGVGAIIIYYDMENDRSGNKYNELETLSKAYQDKQKKKRNIYSWHMNHETDRSSKTKES